MQSNPPSSNKKFEQAVWGLLLLVLVAIVGAFVVTRLRSNQKEGQPLGQSSPNQNPLVYGTVADFNFTNQLGRKVTRQDLKGSIWIANVIFTRCPVQCINLTKQMAGLQSRIGNPEVKFVSLTTDPLFDTPPVLKKYAERFGVQDQRWFFLTGPPQELHDFSVKSLKFVVLEKKESEREEPQDLFVHSLRFAVVDKKGQIRGWVDGEEPDMESKIANLVQQLSGETQ